MTKRRLQLATCSQPDAPHLYRFWSSRWLARVVAAKLGLGLSHNAASAGVLVLPLKHVRR